MILANIGVDEEDHRKEKVPGLCFPQPNARLRELEDLSGVGNTTVAQWVFNHLQTKVITQT